MGFLKGEGKGDKKVTKVKGWSQNMGKSEKLESKGPTLHLFHLSTLFFKNPILLL